LAVAARVAVAFDPGTLAVGDPVGQGENGLRGESEAGSGPVVWHEARIQRILASEKTPFSGARIELDLGSVAQLRHYVVELGWLLPCLPDLNGFIRLPLLWTLYGFRLH
jgi:hypothetical protein